MADGEVSDDDAGNWHEEQRTIEDQGIEALMHVVARDAVKRAAQSLARLRGLHPFKRENDDFELWLDLKHRVLDEFIGVLNGDLFDIEDCLKDCDMQIYRSPEIDDHSDATLESLYSWECICGKKFETAISGVLVGTCCRCEECQAILAKCEVGEV